ncbi:sugar transferase [Microvirga thermotolerans]|uniref:Exopolysaccharide biosynthesis protein n=1 Tax=Microvirga thermotolerans TaxID=2651334 RepID=A0A5P9K2K4_9HYPH|nr:sugar transferase [Microvirga thermotolerans]QFU17865.1 exopolysaccharide biosynthesis protein [Microvirga thermotolerans]
MSPAKRCLDIVAALVLLAVISPLMLLVALGIRFTSPGAILFRQRRHGWKKVPFEIFKFRSMYAECCSDPKVPQATSCDPRVTPVGRLIRRTSIDELPQLLNVLKGEMSLVGPRPHALVHDEKYLAELPSYGMRFAALPGLTGLAQVNGARGETPTLAHMQRRLLFDLEYIRTASLLLDIKILFRTGVLVLTSRMNAY